MPIIFTCDLPPVTGYAFPNAHFDYNSCRSTITVLPQVIPAGTERISSSLVTSIGRAWGWMLRNLLNRVMSVSTLRVLN